MLIAIVQSHGLNILLIITQPLHSHAAILEHLEIFPTGCRGVAGVVVILLLFLLLL